MVEETVDWGEPLSADQHSEWEAWEKSLQELGSLQIPRRTPISEDDITNKVHIYADASERAIAAVAYLQTIDVEGNIHVSFLLGKSKVAPKHGHSIPRLELCAALLAVEIVEILQEQIYTPSENMIFYSDSKVLLGYLKNRTRRFYVYVANRVSRILRFTKPVQWFYVESENNPSDQGTRFLSASMLRDSKWLLGATQLSKHLELPDDRFPLAEPEEDKEIRPEAVVKKTELIPAPVTYLFDKFFRWSKLVKVISLVM
ncbi:uncharacterized protein LOC132559922 [Ylistrum balloti]|uniref:uncharacterized protein LOC132559922 n=1 Tax=Ylistrum balloti TaxID=509963 RepID=UPI00290583C4|nr:uncharacterized protein LOC132559922 [Ylistrum balloti]